MVAQLPNKGSKYYIITKEKSHANEKWEEFVSRDRENKRIVDSTHPWGYSPPGLEDELVGPAIHFQDFISVDFSDGDFGDKSSNAAFTDCNVRPEIPQESVIHQEPSPTLELGFRDLLFLLSTSQQMEQVRLTPTHTPVPSDPQVLMYESAKREIESTTHYIGKYDDKEYRVRGAQLDTIDLDFGDDGIIKCETGWYSSKEKEGPLKSQATFSDLISETIEGWWLNSIWLKQFETASTFEQGRYLDLDQVGTKNYMTQIGCDLSGVKFSLKYNLDSDQGRTFCQKYGDVNELGSLNEFMGELYKNKTEISVEFTNKQSIAWWLELYQGNEGSTEYMQASQFRIAFLFMNNRGEKYILALPNCSLVPNTPNLKSDNPEETLTFNASTGTCRKHKLKDDLTLDETYVDVGSQMVSYYDNESTTFGMGKAKFEVTRTEDWDEFFGGTIAIIRRKADQHMIYLNELVSWDDYPIGITGGIALPMFIWPGTYELIKIRNDTGIEEIVYCGDFIMDSKINHTDNLLDLTPCYMTNVSRAAGTWCANSPVPPVTAKSEPGVDRPFLTDEKEEFEDKGKKTEDDDSSK